MKKKLVFFLIILSSVFLFSACVSTIKENNMINYDSGIYYNKNWDETFGTYQGDIIPNEKTAIAVAEIIFENMEKSQSYNEYVPKSVFFDEPDEIWIVSFSKDSDEIILGGDCNIALQKKDGKVLRIWFSE